MQATHTPIRDFMVRMAEFVSPTTSVRDAARLMERTDVGSLPVVDSDTIVGFVTDRDIVLRVVARESDPHATLVRDVMTPTTVTVREDTDVETAVDMMKNQRIRRIMVVDDKQRLCGILSLCDLAGRGYGRQALAVLKTLCAKT